MIKLSGQSLTPAGLLFPETMGMTLTERGSTAQITLGMDEPELQAGEWLLDDADPGAGIVWRVKTQDSVFNTNTNTYTLEHIINTLRDISMFGEVKSDTITGTTGATTCTAKQAAEYVLGRQSIWTLGDFEYTDSAAYSFNGEDLFSAMEQITNTLEDPCWEYDLTSLPFTLHIRHRHTAPDCEMRMGRNISTLRRTIDRAQMYTRIYPIGKKNLHITGDYLSKNESIWGRKDKVETDQSKETEQMLRLWAQDRLNRHCEPTVTITIAGLELSADTGEDLDHLVIGFVCRVPLPDYGTTITERITKLAWRDKIKEPENVTVTLCNNRQDIASIISEQISGGGGGARADAKEAEEDHAWFVDTTSHVAMVAEAIIGRDGETVDWSRVSEIIVDGSGIHQQVVAAHGSLVTAFGRMDMNDESLATIFRKTGVDSLSVGETLYSKLTQTAESITSEVIRATNAEGSLSSRITQEADKIALVVGTSGNTNYIKTASIVAGINAQTGSYVAISADKIDLTGYVQATDITANFLASKIAEIATLNVNGIACSGDIDSQGVRTDSLSLNGSADFDNVIKSASVNGNTLTLTPASGNAITFSKAVTLTGAWGGTTSAGKTYTVTATMNGGTAATHTSPGVINIATSGSPTYNASTKKLSQTCIVLDSDDESLLQRSVVVNAADAYDAGYTDGEDSVDFDSLGSWSQGYALITLTNGKTTYGQMPSVNSATWTSYRQGTNLLVYCTVGGREYSHTFAL